MRTLSEESSCSNDAESNPKPIDDTAQQCNDLVSEERGKRDDEKNGNGDEPTCPDSPYLLGDRSEFLCKRH